MASVSTGQNKFQTVFQCFVPDAQDVEGVRGRLSAMTVSRDIYGQFSCNLSEIPMSQRSGRRCMWREYILMKNQNRNNGKLASPGSMLRILHRLETAVKTEDKEKVSKQSELDRTTRVHFRYSALPHGRMYNREVPEGIKVLCYHSYEIDLPGGPDGSDIQMKKLMEFFSKSGLMVENVNIVEIEEYIIPFSYGIVVTVELSRILVGKDGSSGKESENVNRHWSLEVMCSGMNDVTQIRDGGKAVKNILAQVYPEMA